MPPLSSVRKRLDIGHLNQAERATAEGGDEVADQELLVAAPHGGSNRYFAIEPPSRRVLEGSEALVHEPIGYLGEPICQ